MSPAEQMASYRTNFGREMGDLPYHYWRPAPPIFSVLISTQLNLEKEQKIHCIPIEYISE